VPKQKEIDTIRVEKIQSNCVTHATRRIPGPASYVDLMDEVVKNRAKDQPNASPIRPSNAGTCARRIAYDYLAFLGKREKIEETRKPSVERLLKLGHFIETHVVDDLKDIPGMGVRFTQQLVDMFDLPGGTTVEGSTDMVMWNKEVRGVGDVKSIGDRWHNNFNSKWDGLLDTYRKTGAEEFGTNSFFVNDLSKFLRQIGSDDSLYKNLIQLNLYACCDFLQKRKVDHAFILRYNKNNSALMEIRFTPSFEVFEDTKRRLSLVEQTGTEGNIDIAPKERVLGQMDCTYCPYKSECWPSASNKDFYKNGKKDWAVKVSELEKKAELVELFGYRANAELASQDLAIIDRELIQLLDGHGVHKVKLESGEVFEVKILKTGAELRRGKE
jgi:hypothetical protein